MSETKIKTQLKAIIHKYLKSDDYKTFIFGSRATGQLSRASLRVRSFSDFDLGILGREKIPGHLLEKIREDLENSSIPYKIDVVDFNKVSPEFRSLALRKIKYL